MLVDAGRITKLAVIFWPSFLQPIQMKKTEIVLIALVVISLVLFFSSMTGAATLCFFSIMALSFYYYVFSFANFNGVGFRGLFRGSSYQGLSALRIVGSIVTGMALANVLIGILFKMLRYTGADSILLAGQVPCLIVLVISLVKLNKDQGPFYKGVLIRVVIIGVVGLIAYFN